MKRILLSGALAVLAGAAFAQSGDDAPPSIEARHGLMENFAFSLATPGTMAKGEMPYDAELAQAAAHRLVVLSTVPQTGHWMDGTSPEDLDESCTLDSAGGNTVEVIENIGVLPDEDVAAVVAYLRAIRAAEEAG